VVLGDVIDRDGQPAPRVFVLCFDAHTIYVYDPAVNEFEAFIETGRGPQALVVDAQRGLGYVAHFIDSYVGVIDLDRRSRTYGSVVLGVGQPSPPRASK
jgi:DNA-binding beta-propeller fold protein YncE